MGALGWACERIEAITPPGVGVPTRNWIAGVGGVPPPGACGAGVGAGVGVAGAGDVWGAAGTIVCGAAGAAAARAGGREMVAMPPPLITGAAIAVFTVTI